MNRRSIIGLSTVAALGLVLYSGNAVGQSAKEPCGNLDDCPGRGFWS
jgi:hypothetical protein